MVAERDGVEGGAPADANDPNTANTSATPLAGRSVVSMAMRGTVPYDDCGAKRFVMLISVSVCVCVCVCVCACVWLCAPCLCSGVLQWSLCEWAWQQGTWLHRNPGVSGWLIGGVLCHTVRRVCFQRFVVLSTNSLTVAALLAAMSLQNRLPDGAHIACFCRHQCLFCSGHIHHLLFHILL